MALTILKTYRLAEHIKTSGLFAGFTDAFGDAQPALGVQFEAYDQAAMVQSLRYVSVTASGGQQSANPSIYEQYPIKISLFGLSAPESEQKERIIIRDLCEQLNEWLVANYRSDVYCIYNITPLSAVAGPFKTDDSRTVYTIDTVCRFDRLG